MNAVEMPQHCNAAAMPINPLQEAEAAGAKSEQQAPAGAAQQSERNPASADLAAHSQLGVADVGDVPMQEPEQAVAEGPAASDQGPGDARRRKVTFMRKAPGQEAGDSSSCEGDSSGESAREDEPAQPTRRLTRAAAARQRLAPNGAPADPPSSTNSPEQQKQDPAPARRLTRAAAGKQRTTGDAPDAAAAGDAPSGKKSRDARPARRPTRAAAVPQPTPPPEEESSSSEPTSSALLLMLWSPPFPSFFAKNLLMLQIIARQCFLFL